MTSKLVLKCDDELWNKVKIFRLQNNLDGLNDAVLELIKRGLKK